MIQRSTSSRPIRKPKTPETPIQEKPKRPPPDKPKGPPPWKPPRPPKKSASWRPSGHTLGLRNIKRSHELSP